MEKITITIEEIEANPNLNLTERINEFASDKRWSAADLRELAIASIKQEYEYYANNLSMMPHIDEVLERIFNGHVFTQDELTELMASNIIEKEEIIKYNDLKKRVFDNNGITIGDFNELWKTIGFNSQTIELIRTEFENQGMIINSYESNETPHR